MEDIYIFIKIAENLKRKVEYEELNQLKKDILWFFDENINQLNSSFVPDYSFNLKYWEYLSLDGPKSFYKEERDFYKEGVLIILLGMTVEYIDKTIGDINDFKYGKLKYILETVENFKTDNTNQNKLKSIAILGLNIIDSMTEEDLKDSEEFEHKDLSEFYDELLWANETFIKKYFKEKISN